MVILIWRVLWMWLQTGILIHTCREEKQIDWFGFHGKVMLNIQLLARKVNQLYKFCILSTEIYSEQIECLYIFLIEDEECYYFPGVKSLTPGFYIAWQQ